MGVEPAGMATKAEEPITIPRDEYAARRQATLEALEGAAAVVLAGEGGPPLKGRWLPDRNFLYLTGVANEPGAAVLFDPSAEDPRRRIVLLLRPLNPEHERWDGYREEIGEALRERTGFANVQRAGALPGLLTQAARRTRRLACLHPFAVYPAPVSADLALFRQVAERVPGIAIEDRIQVLPRQRAAKSAAEMALIRRAGAATAAGFDAALSLIRPGVTEGEIATAIERAYHASGSPEVAYNTIVGTGLNGTILHYMDNAATVGEGDLIVIDSGAALSGYASDVTRTYPAGGHFTPEQRRLYEIVLESLEAGIRAARPGATLYQVDKACRDVIERAGLGDAFIHGAGHPIGLDVHEMAPDGPMAPGMVITVEPGIYLPDQRLGIRIEDDIWITEDGNANLTAQIPRTVQEIEAAMRR